MFFSWILLATMLGIYANNFHALAPSLTTNKGISSAVMSPYSTRKFSQRTGSISNKDSPSRKQHLKPPQVPDHLLQNVAYPVTEISTTISAFDRHNIWFVSDYGSDENDCHTESAPCKNLQTVLDRAADGADIYVTSNELSLDLIKGKVQSRPGCIVNSTLSYSISSYNGTSIKVTCSESFTHWIVTSSQSIASITLKHCLFEQNTVFTLYGLVTFGNCTLGSSINNKPVSSWTKIYMDIYRTPYEPKPSEEMIDVLESYMDEYRIVITRSKLCGWRVIITLRSVIRGMQIIDSALEDLHLYVNVGGYLSTEWNVVSLLIENATATSLYLAVYPRSVKSFGWIKLHNGLFHKSEIISFEGGFMSFHTENCTFAEIDRWSVGLFTPVHVNITNCHFDILDEATCFHGGCGLNVKGFNAIPGIYQLARSIFFPNCFGWNDCLKITVDKTVFHGAAGVSGGAILCQYIDLTLSKCVFAAKKTSKPAAVGGFIYFRGDFFHSIKLTNITLNASAIEQSRYSVSVVTIVIFWGNIEFKNVQMFCPNALHAVEKVPSKGKQLYSCQRKCNNNKYTSEAGSMILEGTRRYWYKRKLTVHQDDPVCFPCPVGANCSNNIKALPNYWGFKNQSGFVRMIRCPEGYCCQDDETCQGINSCNKNRGGILCVTCERNWTESLASPDCLKGEDCRTGLIVVLYILAIVAYSVFLATLKVLNKKIISVLKNIYQLCKLNLIKKQGINKIKQESTLNSKTSGLNEQTVTVTEPMNQTHNVISLDKHSNEKNDDDDDADDMKYIQILFYYVQDASLFKIHLPSENVNSESVLIMILQFSPVVLTTLYKYVSELCFSFGTTAVTKILFKSCFGPCVMSFLFLVYLIQGGMSYYVGQNSFFWKTLKLCLVQAFVLAILFSYQQLVIGAFALVQCVDIDETNVLYVQGDIECYTWWQIATTVYIFMSIFPVFFVLSIFPYYLQNKEISIRMFILACLFPVPTMIFHYLAKLYYNRKRGYGSLTVAVSGCSLESSQSSETIVSEQNQIRLLIRAAASRDKIMTFFSQCLENRSSNDSVSLDTLGLDYVSSDSDTDIGSEYSTDMIRFVDENLSESDTDTDISRKVNRKHHNVNKNKVQEEKVEPNGCRKTILNTLLKHYRSLSIFGVRFTWLGVHKIYRVILVACNTYITEPLPRLFVMTLILIALGFTSTAVKPYKDWKTNMTATLSYAANLCIAMINLCKTFQVTFGCQTNCPYKSTVLWYLGKCEDVLLIYVPVAAVGLWLLYTGITKCRGKSKEE